jgi:hypothetical protein
MGQLSSHAWLVGYNMVPLPYDQVILRLGLCPKGKKTYFHTQKSGHNNFFPNNQNQKITQMSISRKKCKQSGVCNGALLRNTIIDMAKNTDLKLGTSSSHL